MLSAFPFPKPSYEAMFLTEVIERASAEGREKRRDMIRNPVDYYQESYLFFPTPERERMEPFTRILKYVISQPDEADEPRPYGRR